MSSSASCGGNSLEASDSDRSESGIFSFCRKLIRYSNLCACDLFVESIRRQALCIRKLTRDGINPTMASNAVGQLGHDHNHLDIRIRPDVTSSAWCSNGYRVAARTRPTGPNHRGDAPHRAVAIQRVPKPTQRYRPE